MPMLSGANALNKKCKQKDRGNFGVGLGRSDKRRNASRQGRSAQDRRRDIGTFSPLVNHRQTNSVTVDLMRLVLGGYFAAGV